MLRQMRMLYARSNRLVRLFHSCSGNVLIELGRCFCGSFWCSYLWTHYNKSSFSKIRVAYNDLFRKILLVSRRSSASAMFVNNNIPTFECLIRRHIFSFTSRLKVSTNKLINTFENCWLQKYVIWYGNSLFDITEKYIVIAKYLIKYMIYVWRLHKEYTECSLPCSHQGKC